MIATEGHQPCRLLRHSAKAPYGVSMLSSLHPAGLRGALTAVAVGVLAAPSADARTSRNVCENYADQPSGTSDTLACGTQVSIPGHRSRNLDPTFPAPRRPEVERRRPNRRGRGCADARSTVITR